MNFAQAFCILCAVSVVAVAGSASQANELCSLNTEVKIVRTKSYSYASCGFPAASISGKEIAIGDDGSSAGPTSCMAQVCLFDAVTGLRLRHWNMSNNALADLGEHLAPLSELLKTKAFQSMARMEYIPQKRGEIHRGSGLTVALNVAKNASTIAVEGDGYAQAVHRFKPRIAHCESEPDERVVPQSVYPWALEGFPAIVVGAQYGGAEMGCTWMEWIVIPLKQKPKKQPSAK